MQFKLIIVLSLACLWEAAGHGYMGQPSNRASLWRIDWTQPADYNDNEFFCGGVQIQYKANRGKCGACGDNYADPQPRRNENGGFFGNGIISGIYPSGGIVDTTVTLTANHLGAFTYSLCVLTDPSKPETEECFQNLKLADGSAHHNVQSTEYIVRDKVQLPAGLTCERCVLRWHYKSGNSWGVCDDGTQRMGCGEQETFRSCADIAII